MCPPHRHRAPPSDGHPACEKERHQCLLIPGDVRDVAFCRETVERTVSEFGKLDAAWTRKPPPGKQFDRTRWWVSRYHVAPQQNGVMWKSLSNCERLDHYRRPVRENPCEISLFWP
jgi:hypothetical protein